MKMEFMTRTMFFSSRQFAFFRRREPLSPDRPRARYWPGSGPGMHANAIILRKKFAAVIKK